MLNDGLCLIWDEVYVLVVGFINLKCKIGRFS